MPLYEPPVFRPPSEAESLILQATVGCSHNRCAFCGMYATKRFRARTEEEIRADIDGARATLGHAVRRVFLADGDAMCLSTRRLTAILDRLTDAFPKMQRVGIYANARDVLSKTDEELAALRTRKLKMLYVGLESGDVCVRDGPDRPGRREAQSGTRAAIGGGHQCDGAGVHGAAHLYPGSGHDARPSDRGGAS